jgi:Protein of unknown function (DUF2853)
MADTAEYTADIAKYTESVNEAAVAGIVKHLGIALRGKDSSLVSCSDTSELDRVRESWCQKKLALTDDEAVLNKTISDVCEQMAADRTKSRVTFYYLVAEKHGKLDDLS